MLYQIILGKSYENGTQYLKEDKSKAFEFYSKCAELGNKDALYDVVSDHLEIKNFKKAVEYYTRSLIKEIKMLNTPDVVPDHSGNEGRPKPMREMLNIIQSS